MKYLPSQPLLRVLFFLVSACSAACPVQAAEQDRTLPPPQNSPSRFSLGLGAGFATSPYRGHSTQYSPLPLINYEGDAFFIRGLSGGLHLYKEGGQQVSLFASYMPLSFDPDDSDDWRMKRLDKRRATAMAGIGYRLHSDYGTVAASFSGDVLGNNKGFLGDLAYSYPWQLDSSCTISPGLGLAWASEDFNDYYYGVSHAESLKSGLPAYTADSGFAPYFSLSVDQSFYDHWSLFAQSRFSLLASEVKESPMVDGSTSLQVFGGVRYAF